MSSPDHIEKTRVVLIGTSVSDDAKNGLPDIPSVRRNLKKLSEIFSNPKHVDINESEIVVIEDENYAEDIVTKLDAVASEATSKLIVYYAGHGLRGTESEDLFLCSRRTTEVNKDKNGVEFSAIRKSIAESPATLKILVLDCCFAGCAFANSMNDTNLESQIQFNIDLEGTYAIAAVPSTFKALAPPNAKYTEFTGELVSIIETGVETDTSVLTVSEVFEELKRRLNRKGKKGLPVVYEKNNGGETPFVFNNFHTIHDGHLERKIDEVVTNLGDIALRLSRLEQKKEPALLDKESKKGSAEKSFYGAKYGDYGTWTKERKFIEQQYKRAFARNFLTGFATIAIGAVAIMTTIVLLDITGYQYWQKLKPTERIADMAIPSMIIVGLILAWIWLFFPRKSFINGYEKLRFSAQIVSEEPKVPAFEFQSKIIDRQLTSTRLGYIDRILFWICNTALCFAFAFALFFLSVPMGNVLNDLISPPAVDASKQ